MTSYAKDCKDLHAVSCEQKKSQRSGRAFLSVVDVFALLLGHPHTSNKQEETTRKGKSKHLLFQTTMKIELNLILLLAAFLGSVNGAGNEEDVLDENVGKSVYIVVFCPALEPAFFANTQNIHLFTPNPGTLYQQAENTTKFYCTFRNLWTKERQPKKYPDPLARWSGPILWTHTTQFEPWRFGFPCTRGVEKLAEEGFTDHLTTEMEQ